METFYIKSRRKSPFLYNTVEAMSREEATHQVVNACPPGEEIEVLAVETIPFPDAEAAPKDAKAKEHKDK
jgi:hypothetical protein